MFFLHVYTLRRNRWYLSLKGCFTCAIRDTRRSRLADLQQNGASIRKEKSSEELTKPEFVCVIKWYTREIR